MTSGGAARRGSVLVLGTGEDVMGFGLAGVEGVVCASAGDLERALARIDAAADQPALVLVSAAIASLTVETIAEHALRSAGPVVVVLP